MASYHLCDTVGRDVGRLEHPVPNLELGDVVVLADGSEALVITRIELDDGTADAVLEVFVVSRPAHRVA